MEPLQPMPTARGARRGTAASASVAGILVLCGAALCIVPPFVGVGTGIFGHGVATATALTAWPLSAWLLVLLARAGRRAGTERVAGQRRVADERRRLARELHDGLAQELAFIACEAQGLDGAPAAGRVRDAAERALGEARLAISVLTAPGDEPLETALRGAAEAVALRGDARVEVDAGGEPAMAPGARHTLLRIVREATSNAVRHGHARTVRLTLRAGPPLTLTIADDGAGFDPQADRRADAFGLQSMGERADALGGRLDVRSALGDGTRIEVTLP